MIDGFRFNERRRIAEAYRRVCESSYDDSAMTLGDVEAKIDAGRERFRRLFGVIDVYAKGDDRNWAIFVEIQNRRIRFDSQYGEPVDDDMDGEYYVRCRESVDEIKKAVLGPEAARNFEVADAYELDWDGDRIGHKKYIDQAAATVVKIVPSMSASQDDKRYFARMSAEVNELARRMSKGVSKGNVRKRGSYIWKRYKELEAQYYLWGHDGRTFDEFLETVGGYGRDALVAALHGGRDYEDLPESASAGSRRGGKVDEALPDEPGEGDAKKAKGESVDARGDRNCDKYTLDEAYMVYKRKFGIIDDWEEFVEDDWEKFVEWLYAPAD